MLFQLANAKQYAKVAESKGVTVTEGEIDQVIAGQGGQEKFEQQMLQQAVAPSQAREFMRSQVLISKLVAKYGGGTDEAAIQRGQQQAIKDLQAMPITWNPRYGTAQPAAERGAAERLRRRGPLRCLRHVRRRRRRSPRPRSSSLRACR